MLHFHGSQPQTIFVQKIQILVHCLNTQVDGLGFEELHQIPLVGQQVFLVDFIIVSVIEIDGPKIRMDGVLRKIALSQVLLKCFGCPHKRRLPIIFLRNYRANIIGEICDYLLL